PPYLDLTPYATLVRTRRAVAGAGGGLSSEHSRRAGKLDRSLLRPEEFSLAPSRCLTMAGYAYVSTGNVRVTLLNAAGTANMSDCTSTATISATSGVGS